jgi:hypothetical protein
MKSSIYNIQITVNLQIAASVDERLVIKYNLTSFVMSCVLTRKSCDVTCSFTNG